MNIGYIGVIVTLSIHNVAAAWKPPTFETSTSDWIPLTREEVMNRSLRRPQIYPPASGEYWRPKNTGTDPNNVDISNVIKQMEPNNIQSGFKEIKSRISKMIIPEYIQKNTYLRNLTNHIREQRKVEPYFKETNVIPTPSLDITSTMNPVYVTIPINKHYEVKETIVDDISQYIDKEKEYSFGSNPNNKTQVSNVNPKQIFKNIYSKYKLSDADNINYEKSKAQRYENDYSRNMIKLLPNHQNVYRFNSENHLLVDPVLAVFLSNYGLYLAGHYGANADYRNLYGYLASNNIHNNRPFGPYKVFSDTDSSN